MRLSISSHLGVTESMGTGGYLGLPFIIGRKKKKVFGFIKDRLSRCINHWFSKHLSKAGKEILVKSVAQTIPTYCMSVFLLPSTLEDELRKMMNNFWWDSNRQSRKKSIG